jgi:F0F1-type ATP synthase membrane subunit c/vacuolar-type H+-ATPase subunit K
MTTLTHKLRHNRGASLALALLFFLMCALVAATVLAAAGAAATRAAARDDEQQSYFAVSSAAAFVRDDLARATEFVATQVRYEGTPPAGAAPLPWGTTSTAPDCILWELLSEGTMTILGGESSYEKALTFSGITGVEEVTLKFTMDETYNIICTFTTAPSLYTMSLTSQATTTSQTDTTIYTSYDEIAETFTAIWGPAEISKGEAAVA